MRPSSFHTRHHESPTGKQAATWLFNEAKSVASANPAINVTQFKHSWDQPSVIARIPGNSSSLGKSRRPPPLPSEPLSDRPCSHRRGPLRLDRRLRPGPEPRRRRQRVRHRRRPRGSARLRQDGLQAPEHARVPLLRRRGGRPPRLHEHLLQLQVHGPARARHAQPGRRQQTSRPSSPTMSTRP